ncbi:hypothetical protein [Chelativorans sp. AA-79]|uniref:hypothetical protein n=1 Tax=Chelativorans sp. AA-79 TaxID=3028735 RepID=UPI0023F7679A|nr:hypothetical protein [Chelativorans sp. AA-79]WEX10950.1 hypothetical protein PVE73_08465 [Chelativorans sp. AA-79]
MRKIMPVTSTLVVLLWAGSALASNDSPHQTPQVSAPAFQASSNVAPGFSAANSFGPSDQDDLPTSLSRRQFGGIDAGAATPSTFGYPVGTQIGRTDRVYRGYNASDDFGISDQNDLPVR